MAKVNLIDKSKPVFFKTLFAGQLFVYGGELYVKINNLPNALNSLGIESETGFKTFEHNLCVLAVESIDVHL